jgi:hypothetical protein
MAGSGRGSHSVISHMTIGPLSDERRSRGLSPDDMRIVFGLKCEDMVAKYIAGHHEMSMTAWLRAVEAWPEIIELLQETDNERALKGRQRALDLDPPAKQAIAA